jgi:hypothetical protein
MKHRWLFGRVVVVLVVAVVAVAGLVGALGVRAEGEYVAYLPLVAFDPPGPVIHFFGADVATADPGQTIELAWASTGGVKAKVARIYRYVAFEEWDVAPSGSMTYTIGTGEREYIMFTLWVEDAEGNYAGAGLTLPLTCPDVWFFEPAPDGCPGAPAQFALAAEQAFEHGFMVWMENIWSGESGIYVLYKDGMSPEWDFYRDTYVEGEELCDVGEPPDGLQQPVRGFGKVWCVESQYTPSVRARLGWALDDEVGFDGAQQRDSADKYTTWYLRSVDWDVYRLLPERSGWEKIVTE